MERELRSHVETSELQISGYVVTVFFIVCFHIESMDDHGKEKRKQELKQKAKEHRQWFEDMKVKQQLLSKKLSGKRKEDLRKSVIRKAVKALNCGTQKCPKFMN